mmetsp:Transcript_14922/g.40940  ORF Transcript_14922/g.40940 Transcript_14922/m.40940 type:complete len:213 (+) Transcript_14922:252-890(+)
MSKPMAVSLPTASASTPPAEVGCEPPVPASVAAAVWTSPPAAASACFDWSALKPISVSCATAAVSPGAMAADATAVGAAVVGSAGATRAVLAAGSVVSDATAVGAAVAGSAGATRAVVAADSTASADAAGPPPSRASRAARIASWLPATEPPPKDVPAVSRQSEPCLAHSASTAFMASVPASTAPATWPLASAATDLPDASTTTNEGIPFTP